MSHTARRPHSSHAYWFKENVKWVRNSLWRGGYTNLKPGEGSVKLKKRKTGFMEGDLFFLYERATWWRYV